MTPFFCYPIRQAKKKFAPQGYRWSGPRIDGHCFGVAWFREKSELPLVSQSLLWLLCKTDIETEEKNVNSSVHPHCCSILSIANCYKYQYHWVSDHRFLPTFHGKVKELSFCAIWAWNEIIYEWYSSRILNIFAITTYNHIYIYITIYKHLDTLVILAPWRHRLVSGYCDSRPPCRGNMHRAWPIQGVMAQSCTGFRLPACWFANVRWLHCMMLIISSGDVKRGWTMDENGRFLDDRHHDFPVNNGDSPAPDVKLSGG